MTDAQVDHYNEHGFVTVEEITDDPTLGSFLTLPSAPKRMCVPVRWMTIPTGPPKKKPNPSCFAVSWCLSLMNRFTRNICSLKG